jgi:hypothetical protein
VSPANVSGISQTAPRLNQAPFQGSSPQEAKVNGSSTLGAPVAKEGKQKVVDTVSLTEQSQRVIGDVKKEETKKDDVKKEEAKRAASREKADAAPAKVQFVYDLKGELVIKYKDNADRVIYQVPSELKVRQSESLLKSNISFDTKV